MTQEQKSLLIKDLCARLPYGVKIELTWWVMNDGMYMNTTIEPDHIDQLLNDEDGDAEIKPYLFPLSSMSDEQKREFYKFFEEGITESANETRQWLRTKRPDETRRPVTIAYIMVHKLVIEWLLKNHFDYSGLIEKGLAIDATGLNIY